MVNWDEIIDNLRGTCNSLGSEAEGLENDLDFCLYLDSQIFQCTACGWWCEISEEASEDYGLEEWTCLECCEEGTDD